LPGTPGHIQDLWEIKRISSGLVEQTFERSHPQLLQRSHYILQKWQQFIIPCRSCHGKLRLQGDESCQQLNRQTWLAGSMEVNDAPCIFLAHLLQNVAETGAIRSVVNRSRGLTEREPQSLGRSTLVATRSDIKTISIHPWDHRPFRHTYIYEIDEETWSTEIMKFWRQWCIWIATVTFVFQGRSLFLSLLLPSCL